MTLAAMAVCYVNVTLALHSAPSMHRVRLESVEQPAERFVILTFARLWDRWLRTPKSQTVFN